MSAEDARAKIARLIAANPRLTVAELAKRAKVSRQRVHQLVEALELELECVWRKKKPLG